MTNNWTLKHGIHAGTFTSRDVSDDFEYPTREKALEGLDKIRAFLTSIDYQIWYADLYSPEGEVERLEANPYRLIERS